YWASQAPNGDGGSAAPGADRPPLLALDNRAADAHDIAVETPAPAPRDGADDSRGSGVAPGEPMGPRALVPATDLPDGPDRAAVHRPAGKPGRAEVGELAAALKLEGTPRQRNGGWEVSESGERKSGDPRLTVRNGRWTYAGQGAAGRTCGRPLPAAAEREPARGGTRPGCPPEAAPDLPSRDDGPGTAGGGTASEEAAKKAVRPALRALDLGGARVETHRATGAHRTVNAEPRVAGKPTHRWTVTFQVDGDGRVVRGTGHWGGTSEGADYPVMSASRTLNELNKQRQAGRPEAVERSAPQGKRGPAKVVGAAFGYAARLSDGKPVLVPSWIYDVRRTGGKGSYQLAHPAVEPRFLQRPGGEAPSSRPGSPGSSGSSGSKAEDLTSYDIQGRTLTVTFWGGVCETYRATAAESDSRVRVTLSSRPKNPENTLCVKVAKRMTAEVTLDKPLGDRKVVDARDGDVLPRR
ncbi:hypothetical protein, partial [Streptomyces boncukensis]